MNIIPFDKNISTLEPSKHRQVVSKDSARSLDPAREKRKAQAQIIEADLDAARFNPNHEPAGSPEGGEFAPASGGNIPAEAIAAHAAKYQAVFPKVFDRFKEAVKGMGKVEGRVKDISSLTTKLIKKNKTLDQVTDIIGLRVTTPDIATARQALAAVEQEFHVVKTDDRMDNPTDGAYRAIHADVLNPDGTKIEIQLRTENQSKLAEYMHPMYKAGAVSEGTLLQAYVKNLSSALYSRDTGTMTKLPDCPEEVHSQFGCYGD